MKEAGLSLLPEVVFDAAQLSHQTGDSLGHAIIEAQIRPPDVTEVPKPLSFTIFGALTLVGTSVERAGVG